jgi:hypothetical protein
VVHLVRSSEQERMMLLPVIRVDPCLDITHLGIVTNNDEDEDDHYHDDDPKVQDDHQD